MIKGKMNRRDFIRGLLSVAAMLATPFPTLKAKVTQIRSNFVVESTGDIRYIGGSDRLVYTMEELYQFIQEQDEWGNEAMPYPSNIDDEAIILKSGEDK